MLGGTASEAQRGARGRRTVRCRGLLTHRRRRCDASLTRMQGTIGDDPTGRACSRWDARGALNAAALCGAMHRCGAGMPNGPLN